MTTTRIGVVIGRFQPVHRYHITEVLVPALKENDLLIIGLGSSFCACNSRNPWRWERRQEMINAWLRSPEYTEYKDKPIVYVPLKDYPYSDTKWQMSVQRAVNEVISTRTDNRNDVVVTIYGSDKDSSTEYLAWFPQWEVRLVKHSAQGDFEGATSIRETILESGTLLKAEIKWKHLVNPAVYELLYSWLASKEGQRIQEEYAFIKQYKKQFESLPYPPIFQTVDNVVIHKGHVLLIRRGAQPGKGLWALPGGFLNANERIRDGAIRELKEETNIKIANYNEKQYRLQIDESWLKTQRTFDYPGRSLRGRTITTAFLWVIPDHMNVVVEAGDDAAATQWFELDEVLREMDYELFEDHQHIIAHMIKEI